MTNVIATATTDAKGVCYVNIDGGKGAYLATADLTDANGRFVASEVTDVLNFAYDLDVLEPYGSESNPLYPQYREGVDGSTYKITVPANTTYYLAFNFSANMHLAIDGDISLLIDGKTVASVAGKIEYEVDVDIDQNDYVPMAKVPCAVVNSGTEAAEITVAWLSLPGTIGNPLSVADGEGSAEIPADKPVYFKFISDKSYIFTINYSDNATFAASTGTWDTSADNTATVKAYAGRGVVFSLALNDATEADTVTYTVSLEEFVPVPDGTSDVPYVIKDNGNFIANFELGAIYYAYTAPYKCTVKISTSNSKASIKDADSNALITGSGNCTVELDIGDVLIIQVATTDRSTANIDFAVEITKFVCSGNHTWDEGVITTPTSCAAPGVTTYTCIVCYELRTESIEALKHTMTILTPKDATCDEVGYNLHKACTVCTYTEGKIEYPALGHIVDVWTPVTPSTCTVNGVKTGHCSRCDEDVEGALYAQGHTFTSSVDAVDDRYEHVTCSVCECVEYREKVGTITFSSGYLKDTIDLTYQIGGFKVGGVGDPSVEVGSTSTEAGNARAKYSIVGDAAEKVLRMVYDASEFVNYQENRIRVGFTDTIRDTSKDKYLVFDTEIKIDYDPNTVTGNGGSVNMENPDNWYCIVNFLLRDDRNNILPGVGLYVVQNKLHATWNTNFGIPLDPENPEWFDIRIVYTLAETKTQNNKYEGAVHVFARHKDADEPWSLMVIQNVSRDYSYNIREVGYFVEIYQGGTTSGGNDLDSDLQLDNISFISTSDPTYRYSNCDHKMPDEWTIVSAPVDCATPGESKRTCLNGCGYTETKLATIDHTLSNVAAKEATCDEAGYTAHQVCSVCYEKVDYVYIPALGHDLSDWVVEGDKQKKTCANNCGYYELRENVAYDSITFDDGTLTSGGKLAYTDNANVTAGATTATSSNDYATISTIAAPGRTGDTALRVQTVTSKYATAHAPTIDISAIGTAGNVYTLDFDLYVDDAETENGTRSLLQMNFGKAAITLNTYGDSVQFGSGAKGLQQIGSMKEWISVRIIFTVTENGKATYDIYAKDEGSEYVSIKSAELAHTSITLEEECDLNIFTYSTGKDRDYYLDNILLTRHTVGYAVAE